MRIFLPYGRSHVPIELDNHHVDVLNPRRGINDPIRLALATPIGTPPLGTLVKPGQKIMIVTSDITRPCPTDLMLGPIMDELIQAGVQQKDVTLVFGIGLHRPHKPEETAQLMGEWFGRLRYLDFDPALVIPVGVTSRGTPIEAFEPVVKADVRIALGTVEYHYFAGYSGGAKALIPGICSANTIQHNHSMMIQPGAHLGNLEENPVRDDIEEGAALIGLDFILNVIMNEGQVAFAAAGHPIQAHRWACRALDYMSMIKVKELGDIVLVSAGGYPKDINMYQAQKALENANSVLKPGGVIIWVAECSEGLGNATFEQWMVGFTPDEILERIKTQFVLGGHKAAAIARIQKQAAIWLVSSLPPDLVHSCGLTPFDSVELAIEAALEKLGSDSIMIVMPEGGAVFPQVKDTRDNQSGII